MKIAFKDSKICSFGKLLKSVSVDGEEATVKEVSESELNQLIPDSFEETEWKEVRQYYKLDDSGNIVFDEGYEPDEEE